MNNSWMYSQPHFSSLERWLNVFVWTGERSRMDDRHIFPVDWVCSKESNKYKWLKHLFLTPIVASSTRWAYHRYWNWLLCVHRRTRTHAFGGCRLDCLSSLFRCKRMDVCRRLFELDVQIFRLLSLHPRADIDAHNKRIDANLCALICVKRKTENVTTKSQLEKNANAHLRSMIP